MVNKLRNLVLASVMTVSVVLGLLGGLAHAAPAQMADYCPAPPHACTLTR